LSRILLFAALALILGCANGASTEYRFERIDGDQPVVLPFKFDGLYGVRDGALVKAEGYFLDGGDVVTINITLFLRPPVEFQSGTYQAIVGGKMSSGTVECPSLTFQGNQTALPTVGGVFVLKDEQNRALYRIQIPPKPLMGRK